jgi:hypothetical protein
MLGSMVGHAGEPPDALTAFTRPLTGAYYVIPSADGLAALSGLEGTGPEDVERTASLIDRGQRPGTDRG